MNAPLPTALALVILVALLRPVAADPTPLTGHYDGHIGTGEPGYKVSVEAFSVAAPATFDSNAGSGLQVTQTGVVTVSGGSFKGNHDAGLSMDVPIDIDASPKVTIKGGDFMGNANGVAATCGSVTVNKGSFTGNAHYGLFASVDKDIFRAFDGSTNAPEPGVKVNGPAVIITGGDFSHNGYCAVYAERRSTVTISGGVFASSGQDGLYADDSTVTIMRGQFDENAQYGLFAANGSKVTIQSGDFAYNAYCGLYAQSGSKVTLTGGEFSGNGTDLYADGATIILVGDWNAPKGRVLQDPKGSFQGRLADGMNGTFTYGTSEGGRIVLETGQQAKAGIVPLVTNAVSTTGPVILSISPTASYEYDFVHWQVYEPYNDYVIHGKRFRKGATVLLGGIPSRQSMFLRRNCEYI